MPQKRTIIIGAGVGGLVTALLLAARGAEVVLLEAADTPGGKISQTIVDGRAIDAGPTVFTMRYVFDEILASVGTSLDNHLTLQPAEILARHAWGPGEHFDLHADPDATIAEVAAFFGSDEARRYQGFCTAARAIHDAVADTFITGERPSKLGVPFRIGLSGGVSMLRHRAFSTLWLTLKAHFADPRLRQLFGRYATYCGSSPFLSPAILMLIAHVEQQGVWLVEGGIIGIATMLATLAERNGAIIRYGARVADIILERGRTAGVILTSGERLDADAVVVNGDVAALGDGLFGQAVARAVDPVPRAARSLSALTWCLTAKTTGFPLSRHTVFFSRDYAREFDDIGGSGRLPAEPTVYVCAGDRDASAGSSSAMKGQPERLFCLINAPANGDTHHLGDKEIETCRQATFTLMQRCGLEVSCDPERMATSTPTDFHRRFPGTGGALYGRANHDLNASFARPGARTRIPGLYLTGGSVHPGPGVPMAALSGRQAATSVLADFASMHPSRQTVTVGGMSTPSATTARKA